MGKDAKLKKEKEIGAPLFVSQKYPLQRLKRLYEKELTSGGAQSLLVKNRGVRGQPRCSVGKKSVLGKLEALPL